MEIGVRAENARLWWALAAAKQSRLEFRLVASACECLREIIVTTAFRDCLKRFDVAGLIRCMCHPIRLFRGIYFEKRRSFLFRRRVGTVPWVESNTVAGPGG